MNNDHVASVKPRHSLPAFLTIVAVGLYWFSLYLYVPTLPLYAQTITTNLALIGTILAQYGLWQALLRLPLGIAADWIGWRKPFIFLGFILAGLGAWFMGAAHDTLGLFVGRALTGLAAGAWVVVVVAFSSLFPPAEAVRATALLTIANSVARTLATLLTGLLNDLGGYQLAFFLAIVAAGMAALAYLPVGEQRYPPKHPDLVAIGRLVTRQDVLLPSLLNAVLIYISYASTFSFLPILARDFGASNLTLSVLVSMNIAVSVLGNLLIVQLARRLEGRWVIALGFSLSITGLALAWLSASLTWIFAAQIMIGLGNGVAYPTLMGSSIAYVAGEQRSTAMGLHQAVYAIGMFAGPWLSGILAGWLGIPVMFAITALGALVLCALGIAHFQGRPLA